MGIDYKIKRLKVRWRRFKRRFDKGLYPEKEHRISPYQEKAIRLWRMVLKDADSKLGVSSYGVRQVERENLVLVFQDFGSSNDETVLTIMDTNDNGNNLYELHIGKRHAILVCEAFDDEMDRRMNRAESAKRLLIESDLDHLLQTQEEKMKSQRVSK
jgi:hypothetical protein